MPVKFVTAPFGHSMKPKGPHTITLHAPTWDVAVKFRGGDQTLLAQLKSIYPRFGPFGLVKELFMAVHQRLGLPPSHGLIMWLSPEVLAQVRDFAQNKARKDARIAPGELSFRVVDIGGVRLYGVVYPLQKTPAVLPIWQNYGAGISSRLAESLLPQIDTLAEVDLSGIEDPAASPPPPTWLPEGPSHAQLRERIAGLLHHAAVDPEKVKATADDVSLHPSGMAAICRAHQLIMKDRPGSTLVLLGSLFHNTLHMAHDNPGGWRHFGEMGASSEALDELEAFCEAEAAAGRKVAYALLEFPSNPILVSADLTRLRRIADKHGFPLVIDDTIGSFANIDVLSASDVLVSSLTKTFSGYADLIAGSIVLNPLSPFYSTLKEAAAATAAGLGGSPLSGNAFFTGDADKLLSNSADYLARSAIANRNAAALAAFFQSQIAGDPSSAVTKVFYPPQQDDGTLARYAAVMRRPTPDFTPGYGCLLSVELATRADAVALYDALGAHFWEGPHLGAPETLAMCYHELAYGGAEPADAAFHARYGCRIQQIRISAGLEDVDTLIDSVKFAMAKAAEGKVQGETQGVVENVGA